MDKITFYTEDNEAVEFYVLDQTRINAMNYLLVADSLEEEAEALILKDIAKEDEAESIYEIVEDDRELEAVARVFEESLGDVDIK